MKQKTFSALNPAGRRPDRNAPIEALLCILIFLAACQPILTPATESGVPSIQSTPTYYPEPTPTPPRTPPALPAVYQSSFLNPLDTPRTYIKDTCQYLRSKWDPNNAVPGTVVMIVMFKGIYRGFVESRDGVDVIDFHKIMKKLKQQGFEAINTQQLLDFLTSNKKIPFRSVVITQDDRHLREHFEDHYREYWEQWGWPVVNGWVSDPGTTETLWEENIALENEGWVDHQSQGVMTGTNLTDTTSKAVIARELEGSITAFNERFKKDPIAIIWPGGGFGVRPVEQARQIGFQLGFTINSRGPVMFNWVPLADDEDPQRPSFPPEGGVNDPLMTLPRYWPYQVIDSLDQVRLTGRGAADYAEQNKAVELEYYDIVCAPTYGSIPAVVP